MEKKRPQPLNSGPEEALGPLGGWTLPGDPRTAREGGGVSQQGCQAGWTAVAISCQMAFGQAEGLYPLAWWCVPGSEEPEEWVVEAQKEERSEDDGMTFAQS